jgi:hypothetical protein
MDFEEAVQNAKKQFLARFANRRIVESSAEIPLRDAMFSSSKRAHLFRSGLTQAQRYQGPRAGWAQRLRTFVRSYERMRDLGQSVTFDEFKRDCDLLTDFMNDRYSDFFGL